MATGLVTAGPGSTTGGLVATDNFFGSLPSDPNIPTGFTPAAGTATNSYWDTQTTGQSQSAGGTPQTTAQLTSGVPAGFDSNTWSSGAGTNYPFFAGQSDPLPTPGDPANNPDPPPPPPPPPSPPQNDLPQNIAQVSPLLNIISSLTSTAFTEKQQEEVIKTSEGGTPSGSSSGSPGGSSKGGGAGNAGRPPINSVPPVGLGPLPSGMPPLNETRFASNEVVMQLGVNLTPEQVAALARQYGLEVIHSQAFSLLGRTVYRFRITGGLSVRDAIAGLQSRGATISAQPSYTFTLGQASAAPAARQGDSAQYIVAKLGLRRGARHLDRQGREGRGDRFGNRRAASRPQGRDRRHLRRAPLRRPDAAPARHRHGGRDRIAPAPARHRARTPASSACARSASATPARRAPA